MAEITLTQSANGGRVSVHVGDVIVVRLFESSGAGYRWTVHSLDQSGLSLTSREYVPESSGIGAAGHAVFRLEARRAGDARLELRKVRPWEASRVGEERFVVDVIVQSQ